MGNNRRERGIGREGNVGGKVAEDFNLNSPWGGAKQEGKERLEAGRK